jgi:hypothetical protein
LIEQLGDRIGVCPIHIATYRDYQTKISIAYVRKDLIECRPASLQRPSVVVDLTGSVQCDLRRYDAQLYELFANSGDEECSVGNDRCTIVGHERREARGQPFNDCHAKERLAAKPGHREPLHGRTVMPNVFDDPILYRWRHEAYGMLLIAVRASEVAV